MSNDNTNSRRLVLETEPAETDTLEGNVSWNIVNHHNQQTIESGLVLVGIRGDRDTRRLRSSRHYNHSHGARRQTCQQTTKSKRFTPTERSRQKPSDAQHGVCI